MMDQTEIDRTNRYVLAELLRRLPPGELVAAAVTVKADCRGVAFYPAVEGQAAELLDILRTKPDEVFIERRS